MYYRITTDRQGGTDLAGLIRGSAEAVRVIDYLSGRAVGHYIVTRAIPSTKRRWGRGAAYVAANRGAPCGVTGFHVEAIPAAQDYNARACQNAEAVNPAALTNAQLAVRAAADEKAWGGPF